MSERSEFSPEHSGKEVSVPAGSRIILRLPENPTTGWRWKVPALPPNLELVGDSYGKSTGDAGIGAATTRVLEYRVISSGKFTLELDRAPEWDDQQTPDAHFSLGVTVINSSGQ